MDEVLDAIKHNDAPIWYALGTYEQDFDSALSSLEDANAVQRVWTRDGSVWRQPAQTIVDIEKRLGWLDLPQSMRIEVLRLRALAAEVQAAGIERVVLLGMGGSSLAPEVMHHALGVAPGHPDLVILDSTDPAQVRRIAQETPLLHTLFIVASKSGTTAETINLLAYFKAEMIAEVGREHWREHFIAITDPGTPLAELARSERFRALYLNPADIGGRYSALSLFGLVPAALMGVDIDRLLRRAKDMVWSCKTTEPSMQNPGVVLGAIMGTLACHPKQPRDKLTLITSAELAPLGNWIEQLIAESTGKRGQGILPVAGEFMEQIDHYGMDRLFGYLRLKGAANDENDTLVARVATLGHPIVVLPLNGLYDLGATFFLWEFATAIAGQILGINPFDQPDVDSAKVQARSALAHYEETRALPVEPPVLDEEGLAIHGPSCGASNTGEYLKAFFAQAKSGNYVALMAYVERNGKHDGLLQRMRCVLTERLHLAVTIGFGPRFLHSTGQLHKGGPNTGLFLQITQDEAKDLPIPEHSYSFGILKRAQARGDMEALKAAERRVIRIHIGGDVEAGLRRLATVIEEAV